MDAIAKHSRQRRRPDTLDKILVAAREEFSAKGLSGAQVEAIARNAGVTKQLVYYYFGSRTELYEAMLKHATEQCLAELRALPLATMAADAAMRLFFGTIHEFYARMPFLVSLALDVNFQGKDHLKAGVVHRGVTAIFEGVVDRAVNAGLAPPDFERAECFSIAMLILCGSFLGPDRVWGHADPPTGPVAGTTRRKERALTAIMAIMALGEAAPGSPPAS